LLLLAAEHWVFLWRLSVTTPIEPNVEGRRFIRHPIDIPIEASDAVGANVGADIQAFSVGQGGLAFHSARPYRPGTLIRVRIACVDPAFESHARVAWTRGTEPDAEVGVEFLNSEDAFRARMVEQVCHIEKYRLAILETQGRRLTFERAATEWISKYAAEFPSSELHPRVQ
jgi:hypothetical protein